ncbi:endo alpha-1,4 polygalactosaminidase [Rhizobium alvei]|uniref:Endo alpha-1,4 polygalactosaminidase n=1 Tax=Rhizobium alvei TaxID=1132659 RepID=A0ABT8YN46_9HYPH|nr:endo alpha-1,4 polygalactosaminidase [Rhizobium alvei]MDO6965103.1 endo alpha-1,4 polygalactosaminidase [Rhizobium alvei]
MPKFKTSTGTITVNNWGYQLQGMNRPLDATLLSQASHDLLVIDSTRDGTNATRFSANDITRMKDGMGGLSVVASYISIGEASDFRDYWDPDWTTTGKASGRLTDLAPDWLGPLNPDWPESRKVRYWDDDWQNLMFNSKGTGDFDAIVKAGFDAAYLDIVDAYYFWGEEVANSQRQPGDPKNEKQAAQRMVDFVVDMAEHAQETNPDFFMIPQNGAWIIDALKTGTIDKTRIEAYRDAIGAIAIEDLYFRGGKDENNVLRPDEATIRVLKRDFLDQGIPVFVVDYINDPKKVARFEKLALEDGFIPFAAPDRELNQLTETHDGDPAYIRPDKHANQLRGSMLRDEIDGLGGNDHIDGRGGNDWLAGGEGKDVLTGGSGRDTFHFAEIEMMPAFDTVKDFTHAVDRITLDRDGFLSLPKGVLDRDSFVIAHSATNSDEHIIYNPGTGYLSYDEDGKGGRDDQLIAKLVPGTTLTATDIWVV